MKQLKQLLNQYDYNAKHTSLAFFEKDYQEIIADDLALLDGGDCGKEGAGGCFTRRQKWRGQTGVFLPWLIDADLRKNS